MNYELAKELKDASFPQPKAADDEWHTYPPMFPTLSELIEACLPRFTALEYTSAEPQPWHAYFEDHAVFQGFGSTPSEAAAKLYLALNAKE